MLKRLTTYSIYAIHLDPKATNHCVWVFVQVHAGKKKTEKNEEKKKGKRGLQSKNRDTHNFQRLSEI